MNSKATRRVLSLVLSVCMVLTASFMGSFSAFADVSSAKAERLVNAKNSVARLKDFKLDNNEKVRVIITLEGSAMIDKEIAGASQSSVNSARKAAVNQQKALQNKMSKKFDYELLYNYNALLNGMAIETQAENIYEIAQMDTVTGVYLVNKYDRPDFDVLPMTEYSSQIIGADTLHNSGYTGDGIKIAVLDTGLRVTHEAFKDYGIIDNLTLTKDGVESIKTLYEGKWISNKVPFTYDYADKDDDVSDDDEGHGTHVAGIACGYAASSDGAVTFSGQAPAAQLFAMKIFMDGIRGTDSSIYLAALEDSYRLGADIINMSIGKPGGFTHDAELEDKVFGNIYEKLDKSGIILSVAAGNEYSMAYGNYSVAENTVPASYTDYGTVGSPSTYLSNISVASYENTRYPVHMISAYDSSIKYSDGSKDLSFSNKLGGKSFKYVVIPGTGTVEDFTAADSLFPKGEEWIALVKRGNITFQEKLENAYMCGASAMICYNNTEGEIGMAIDNYLIPAVSMLQKDGEFLVSNASNSIGTLTVDSEMTVVDNDKTGLMSDFSNWGSTSDLQFKPQVSAPGGNICSASSVDDGGYVVYGGTSMAAPNSAGLFACVLEYLREQDSTLSKVDCATKAKDLIFSTAEVNCRENEGELVYDSPRKQGAGIMNANNLIAASAYVENGLVALGDDPAKTGKFEFDLTVKSLDTSKALSYTIGGIVLTDDTYYSDEAGTYLNTLTAFDLLKNGFATISTNLSNDQLKFSAGEASKNVKVTVQLTQSGKEYLNERFENGIYVEGYIFFVDDNGASSDIHASFLGYYGDWTAGDIMESFDFGDAINLDYEVNTTVADAQGNTYADYGYTLYDFLSGKTIVGFNEAYLYSTLQVYDEESGTDVDLGHLNFVGNHLFTYLPYDPVHNVMSNSENRDSIANILIMYPALLRNAEHMIMIISDKETGEIYYVDDTPYASKAYYDSESSSYGSAVYFFWDGKNTYDEDSLTYGKYVENNSKLRVQFYGWLDYEKDIHEKYVSIDGDYTKLLSADWDAQKLWGYDLMIDSQSPEVSNMRYNASFNSISMTLSDNHCLAYYGISDEEGNYYYEEVLNTRKGGTSQVMIPLEVTVPVKEGSTETKTLQLPDKFYLEAMDYATNNPLQEVYFDRETGRVGVKDYKIEVYASNGKLDEKAAITLTNGSNTYEYGDLLEIGKTYNILVDGKETGEKISIVCFGENYAKVGVKGFYNVSIESILGDDAEAYSLTGDVTLSKNGQQYKTDANEDRTAFTAEVELGSYDVYYDGVYTGIAIDVTESSLDEISETLHFYSLSYDDNAVRYEGNVPETQTYLPGTEITIESADMVRMGSTFVCWNTNIMGTGTDYAFNSTFVMPENDVVLYAVWKDDSELDDETLYGDVDCDKEITLGDAIALQKILAGLTDYSDYGENSERNADADKSGGKPDLSDVIIIQKHLAGLVKLNA